MTSRKSLQDYLLWHTHILDGDERDEKLLGVYSSEERAEQRKKAAVKLVGFRESPDGFEISRYVVDRDEWSEGYVTS